LSSQVDAEHGVPLLEGHLVLCHAELFC
jgi:hypothetical protein